MARRAAGAWRERRELLATGMLYDMMTRDTDKTASRRIISISDTSSTVLLTITPHVHADVEIAKHRTVYSLSLIHI